MEDHLRDFDMKNSSNSRCKSLPSNSGQQMAADNNHTFPGGMKAFRKFMRQRLQAFIASKEPELTLETMSREMRRQTHVIARKLDLRSSSHGTEPNRYMTITYNTARRNFYSSVNGCQSVALSLKQLDRIRQLIVAFPIEPQHIDEHFSLPDKHTTKSGRKPNLERYQPLIPPEPARNERIQRFRRSLPAFELRADILSCIDAHRVALITGGTGCGKTTQVPQFLLEEATNLGRPLRIMCTQPRRLPALAVAKRVALERGERLGATVGYHIRLEQKTSAETALTYCTSGVLLRMLTADELARDMTHIILDEVHEREQNTDYLLIALKHALQKRQDLKVILMSATMGGNMQLFMNYFDSLPVGHVDMPSRLYNVDKFDLADILALTGYMPQSIFGGLFDASTSSDARQQFTSFPPVGEFRCDDQFTDLYTRHSKSPELHTIQTEPNLMSYYTNNNNPPSSYGSGGNNDYPPASHFDYFTSSNGHKDYGSGGFGHSGGSFRGFCSGFQTADDSFGNDGFGFSRQATATADEISRHLDCILPNRPEYFDSKIVAPLRKADFDRRSLVDLYLNAGGQQWTDGVDAKLTAVLIRYLALSKEYGAILVFLPGYDDIVHVRDEMMNELRDFSHMIMIYTLHSQINSLDQQRVFDATPAGQRKIILSTNIAEASLTIDDVVFVIDCGKIKEKTYDHATSITELKVSWIAKSNAEQRAGRAGRCRNGFCFRLYTRREYDEMMECQIAEMKRSAIHDVCLHAKMFAPEGMTVSSFLQMAPEPPAPAAIDQSMQFLEQLGALFSDDQSQLCGSTSRRSSYRIVLQKSWIANDRDGDHFGEPSTTTPEPSLTELGCIIAHLPLDPQLSRMLLFGVALKCFGPVVTLVAALSHRDPFVLPMGEDRTAAVRARDEFGRRDFSDHLMLIRAVNAYNLQTGGRADAFCRSNYLNVQAMRIIRGIRKQLIFELKRLRFLPSHINTHDHPDLNLFGHSWPMVQGAIVAGCYPGIGYVRAGSKLRKIRTSCDVNAQLHPSSVIKRQVLALSKRSDVINQCAGDLEPIIEYMVYQELSQIEAGLTIRTVTVIPPISVFLFAGPLRMSKEAMDNFEITEDDIPSELFKKRRPKSNSGWGEWDESTTSWPELNGTDAKTSASTLTVDQVLTRDPAVSSTSIIVEHEGDFLPSAKPSGSQPPPQRTSQRSALSIGASLFMRGQRDQTNGAASICNKRLNKQKDLTDDKSANYIDDISATNLSNSAQLDTTVCVKNKDRSNRTPTNHVDDDQVEEEDDSDDLNYPGVTFAGDPEPEYALRLDDFLSFQGTFETMQALVRLRFKLLNYFLTILRTPARETTESDMRGDSYSHQQLYAEHCNIPATDSSPEGYIHDEDCMSQQPQSSSTGYSRHYSRDYSSYSNHNINYNNSYRRYGGSVRRHNSNNNYYNYHNGNSSASRGSRSAAWSRFDGGSVHQSQYIDSWNDSNHIESPQHQADDYSANDSGGGRRSWRRGGNRFQYSNSNNQSRQSDAWR